MNFEEHAAKPRLAAVGIKVPASVLVYDADAGAKAAERLGGCVVKAQVPVGKRGKAGGIKIAHTPEEARSHVTAILGMEIGGHYVEKVMIEKRTDIKCEYYAAVLNDPRSKSPMVVFSTEGGMDIEEIAAKTPQMLKQHAVDIRHGFTYADAIALLQGLDLSAAEAAVADALEKLFQAYTNNDAELLEINPLIVTGAGEVVALDCKYVMDDSSILRQGELAKQGAPDRLTEREARGAAQGIKYIELDGDVCVLANGAGLTMTTMDMVRYHGGAPANFCEIGGQAYTKAHAALELILSKPGLKSLVVNFCGAFARCDVMMAGLLHAWNEIKPDIPVFFSIAGTGDEAAIRMLDEKLGMKPLADMNAACKAAVAAAKEA